MDLKGDEIVISGISGCFPDAEDTKQLSEKLFNKIDMVTKTDEFAHIKHPEFPQYYGKIKDLEKFDAQFFRVTHWQADTLDPFTRKILEHTFAAFFDAGINPETLKGSKLGVFIGSMQSDFMNLCFYQIFKRNVFILSGTAKTMQANRVSYWADGKGPSYSVDCGCAGSMGALEMAYTSMKTGEIDSAVVGGCNICIHAVCNLNMKRAGLLCLDGKTKCFDKKGDGYVRSDAINILFLQKAKDAKRIYSEVYHVKGKYFATPDASFSLKRNPKDIEKFLEEFYSDIDVSPKDVEYIEANGFGIAEADGNELEAIGNVFCKDKILHIGSVKSNMGNTEAASGACSLTKMCLAYQKGCIPANLHLNEPQNNIPAVKEGRLQVVTEHVPFKRSFTAINNFCYTGSNFHTLLKGHYKPKDTERYKSSIPRLVLISGRGEDSVTKMLDILETNPMDPEQYKLLNNFFKYNVPGYTGRGYTILDSNENNKTVSVSRGFEFYSGNTRPVWFLYSGMGSQWAGMGEGLLRLPVFAAAIERCNNILLPKGLDIVKIITDKSGSLNILNSLVAITAIQIGLTDVLKSVGVIPANIIGHSVGEIGCAYADGSLTAEETILASYSRAIVSYETQFIKGKMAAVGLGHKEVIKLCPPEIQVACHNSSESATITGPVDSVTEFVKSLTEQGIFAKEVASSNIAFHSQYIAKAGPDVLKLLNQFITEPKLRSKKWLSTCYPPEDWHKPESKYASAEYFTHNLLSSVLFEEAAALIPDDAIIIEIAPHGLLQAIMKRSHSQCMNLSLTRRGEENSINLLLETIGKLYQAGVNPDLDALYPKVEFPVSTETPLLSHFVQWDHSMNWNVEKCSLEEPKTSTNKEFNVTIYDTDYIFLKNHIRNGVNVLPEAAMLVFAWETLAEYNGTDYKNLSVVFKDINFHSNIILKHEEALRLNVAIQKGSNRFEVTTENRVVADGFIYEVNITSEKCGITPFSENERHLNKNDVYALLSRRGYSYGEQFKSIESTNIERNKATIQWNEHWITFLDSVIQFNAFSKNHDGVSEVKLINKLSINVKEHIQNKYTTTKGIHLYNAIILEDIGRTKCGGVTFEDIIFTELPQTEIIPKSLKTRHFVAHTPSKVVNLNTALQTNVQVVCENISNNLITIKEIVTDEKSIISNKIKQIGKEIPLPVIKVETVKARYYHNSGHLGKNEIINADVLIFHNLLGKYKLVEEILNNITENTFILTIENEIIEETDFKIAMETITVMHTLNQTIILMKKTKQLEPNKINLLFKQADDVSVSTLGKNLKKDMNNIVVVEKTPQCSVLGMINNVKKYENTYLFVIDTESPTFTITNNYYKSQIQKNLKINILNNNQWGSYVYISACAKPKKVKHVKLIATELNNFNSFLWTEAPVTLNEQTIQVCYSGLSTKDCNKLSKGVNTCFGMDFSGLDRRGNKVMGLIPQGAMASLVEADNDLLWPVPQHWTLAEAATVPLPYIHAFYCLHIKSFLNKNSNVLVTGAAGALGQAVISIVQSLGCTVFATVSNADKKRFLLKLFPKLDENNIGYNYDGAFKEMVLGRTQNERCNTVINCCSGKIREAAMGCVRFDNYFLDVNDSDYKDNEKFGMFFLREAKSYKSVNMSSIFEEKYCQDKKILKKMLSEGIAKGYVRPLTSVIYAPTDISRAFKLLSNKNNRGRVLINMKDPMMLKDDFEVTPRLMLSQEKSYIAVCDGTELGIDLIDCLIKKGARHILVHCNPKLLNGYFHVKYASWSKLGVTIEFNSDDLQTELSCRNLIEKGKKIGFIDGIFIVHKDIAKTYNTISIEQNNGSTALVVSNLDKASRKCSDLRYFVVIAATSPSVSDEYTFEEIEKTCSLRHELGVPSLFLRHIWNDENLLPHFLSMLFNAMESSLKNKYVSVLSSDSIDGDVNKPSINLDITSTNTNFNGGLQAFCSHILKDECIAAEPIVQMKTKLTLSYEHDLLINPEDTYIMMIPGIEGNYEVFTSVSERLKKPAMVLQLDPNMNESIPEMAKKLYEYARKRLNLKSPFYLMGYSFGVNVALELAVLLEKEGLIGVVVCLDSSPDAMRIHLDAYLGNFTDKQLQNSIIEHFYKLFAGVESRELKNILEETTEWCDKIEVFIRKVKNVVSHSHQYMTNILQATYDRIIMAKEYNPKYNLESELVLLKGIPHPNAVQQSDDYNLSKYTNKEVKVFGLRSDHALIPSDLRLSNFINMTFDL